MKIDLTKLATSLEQQVANYTFYKCSGFTNCTSRKKPSPTFTGKMLSVDGCIANVMEPVSSEFILDSLMNYKISINNRLDNTVSLSFFFNDKLFEINNCSDISTAVLCSLAIIANNGNVFVEIEDDFFDKNMTKLVCNTLNCIYDEVSFNVRDTQEIIKLSRSNTQMTEDDYNVFLSSAIYWSSKDNFDYVVFDIKDNKIFSSGIRLKNGGYVSFLPMLPLNYYFEIEKLSLIKFKQYSI
jgi:hypothetical protein